MDVRAGVEAPWTLTWTSGALVADPRWRWASGVRWRFDVPHHANIWSIYEGDDACDADGGPTTETAPHKRGPVVIDLDHPATAGVIVGMLAATGRLHHIDTPRTNGRGWLVVIFDGAPGHEAFTDTSLGRAAARAWLAVPRT